MRLRVLVATILSPVLAFGFQNDTATLEQAHQERYAARYDHAAELYAGILAADPRNSEAHYGRVFSLIRAKRSNEAYQAVDLALRQAPDTAGTQAAAGLAAFRRGDISGAEIFFQTARKFSPQYPGATRGLGSVYATVSKFRSAREMLQLAYNKLPDDPDLMLAYANTLTGKEHIAGIERALGILDPATEEAKHLRLHIAADRAIGDRSVRTLASTYQSSRIKLIRVSDGRSGTRGVSIRVQINQKENVRLLLDTGASGIAIAPKLAAKAGLEKLAEEEGEAKGIGDGKAQSAYEYLAAELRIGDVQFRDFPVSVFRAAQSADYDGLIGADVFGRFLVTVDFQNMELRLDPRAGGSGSLPDEPEDSGPLAPGYTRALRFGNHLALPTLVNRSKDPKLFLIDSGAQINLIDTATARTITGVYADSRAAIRGIQGQVDRTSRASHVELVFAGFRNDNADLLSIDLEKMGDSMGVGFGGIIGMPILGLLKMTIDYHEGTVRFEYR